MLIIAIAPYGVRNKAAEPSYVASIVINTEQAEGRFEER